MAVTGHAKSWDEHLNDVQTGYASNYGLGSSGNVIPKSPEWNEPEPSSQGWNYEGIDQQMHREAERSFWQSQQYDPLRNMKPIAPCGPYYAPRASKNCY